MDLTLLWLLYLPLILNLEEFNPKQKNLWFVFALDNENNYQNPNLELFKQ